MNGLKRAFLLLALSVAGPSAPALADQQMSVDVVHFWISKSEASALDVFRKAWISSGNKWVDMSAENKVAVQRVVSDRIANGYPPAVMQWNANYGSRELPEMGIVQDIEDVARADNWQNVVPASILERISYQGKVYFAPTDIHAENWLWTSKKVFADAGLDLPRSWDDIFSAAEKIKAAGYVPIALGGARWEASLIFNNIIYEKFGPEGYARLMSGDATLVLDPRMIDALKTLLRVADFAEPLDARKNKTWADAAAAVGAGQLECSLWATGRRAS